jgi:protein-tyrosine-phosphatase
MTYRIALVCLGNICRSPIAHVVLEDRLARAGLDDRVEVVSSGTGGWHDGEPMDRRAAAVLRDAGYDPSRHRARTFSVDWYAENDLILAMDHSNRADMLDVAPTVEEQGRIPPLPRVRPAGHRRRRRGARPLVRRQRRLPRRARHDRADDRRAGRPAAGPDGVVNRLPRTR